VSSSAHSRREACWEGCTALPRRGQLFAVVDKELQCAFKDVRDLLIVMNCAWAPLPPFLTAPAATIRLVPTSIAALSAVQVFLFSMSFHLECFAIADVSAWSKSYHIQA